MWSSWVGLGGPKFAGSTSFRSPGGDNYPAAADRGQVLTGLNQKGVSEMDYRDGMQSPAEVDSDTMRLTMIFLRRKFDYFCLHCSGVDT